MVTLLMQLHRRGFCNDLACYNSVDVVEEAFEQLHVSLCRSCSFSSRGFYMDGPSIFSSAVLLLVLLALTFQRILGLDRLVTKALK
jgi:hypothetical protein